MALLCSVSALSACQRASVPPLSSDTSAVDDGTTLTMWVRSLTATFSRTLVDAYNATHRNKIRLTVMPTDSYQQRVGAAAGAGHLPDLLATDVVYAPNYASKGVFLDITARVSQLPFKIHLAPSHMEAVTYQGSVFGVPHDIDIAALFYNKGLFIKAGLDGDDAPQSLEELYAFAKKINALGDGVHGYYFGGACPDCMVVTTWPMVWASGSTVLNSEGTVSTINNPAAAQAFALYRRMYQEGIVPASAKNESGPTWTQGFANGLIGMQPMGATALQTIEEGPDLQVGVAAIPGPTGGASSFVGGDVLGIGANSRHAAQAWDFVAWTLSEEAQVEVVAKNKNITVRDDLADNVYTQQDPRLVILTQLARIGQTPTSVNFGRTFNDPNGPWISTVTDAVFGSADVTAVLDAHNDSINDSLALN
jgi:multiple sugar transport system substrate-binding protein